jgi:hypothetical protein
VVLLAPIRVSAMVPNPVPRADNLAIAAVLAELEERGVESILGYRPSFCEEF